VEAERAAAKVAVGLVAVEKEVAVGVSKEE
jgi:hypothetical protein